MLFFILIVLAIIALLIYISKSNRERRRDMKRCPTCKLWYDKDETTCRVCKKDLPIYSAENIQGGKTKQCPYCAERIKAEAVVCKHCGRDLPKGEAPQTSSPYEFK